MPIKKRTLEDKKPLTKNTNKVTFEQAEQVANELADKQYYEEKNHRDNEIERLTISLSGTLYDKIDSLSRERRKKKLPNKSMSAIAAEAIEKFIIHNS
ncbi:hypothetical protein L3V86_09295 [Thiotrichales bacterium 19S11-10]|nr:hypothetical protein [Thiotrichales bacterium 19S11-10]